MEDRGGESFEICDPIPVTLDDEGYLVAPAEEGNPCHNGCGSGRWVIGSAV
jgi:hypothetical protein